MANSTLPKFAKMAKLALLLFTINSAHAYAQIDGVEGCRALENDMARLACYDTLFGPVIADITVAEVSKTTRVNHAQSVKSAATASNVTASSIANTPAIPNVVDKVMNQRLPPSETDTAKNEIALPKINPPSAAIATTTERAIAVKPVAKATKSAEASFGAEQLVNNDPANVVSNIQARVVKVTASIRGLRTFVLDNGQHWKESESNRLQIKEAQLVMIKKGALSAYYLSKAQSGRTMRVKRVK